MSFFASSWERAHAGSTGHNALRAAMNLTEDLTMDRDELPPREDDKGKEEKEALRYCVWVMSFCGVWYTH
jgi:hypothetical protein